MVGEQTPKSSGTPAAQFSLRPGLTDVGLQVPAGMGVQDGSMAGVYALLGVPFGPALLAAVLFRVVYYLVPFAFGLAVYARLLRRRTT